MLKQDGCGERAHTHKHARAHTHMRSHARMPQPASATVHDLTVRRHDSTNSSWPGRRVAVPSVWPVKPSHHRYGARKGAAAIGRSAPARNESGAGGPHTCVGSQRGASHANKAVRVCGRTRVRAHRCALTWLCGARRDLRCGASVVPWLLHATSCVCVCVPGIGGEACELMRRRAQLASRRCGHRGWCECARKTTSLHGAATSVARPSCPATGVAVACGGRSPTMHC